MSCRICCVSCLCAGVERPATHHDAARGVGFCDEHFAARGVGAVAEATRIARAAAFEEVADRR